MTNDIVGTGVGQQYAAAHAEQYETKDLQSALTHYQALVVAHPDTPEAGYSRSQIQNIVKAVVPLQTFTDAQADLAALHLARADRPDAPPAPVAVSTAGETTSPSTGLPPRQAVARALSLLLCLFLLPTSALAQGAVADIPAHAHAKSYGIGWECDWGYRAVEGSCEAITIPARAHLDPFGGRWNCDRGYRDIDEGCVPVEVPPHAFLNSSGHGWQCDRGYERDDQSCVALVVPPNAYLTASGERWECERGSQRSGSSCVAFVVPANAHIGYSGNAWTCHPGYRQHRGLCLPVEPRE